MTSASSPASASSTRWRRRFSPSRRLERRRGHRLAKQESLHFLAALLAQELQLAGGFDAFGGDAEAESARHSDDGGDDGAVGRARFDLLHELLIDFYAVDREAAQVIQRRVAGAEIV